MDRDQALLSTQELRTTAELARLLMSDDEVTQLRGELAAILAYVAQLGELDVTGVPAMTHAVAFPCPLRADVVATDAAPSDALRNAPAPAGRFFAVPATLATASAAPESQAHGAS